MTKRRIVPDSIQHPPASASMPVSSAPLIGREDEIRHVLNLLDGSPLVTLFGVAGVGKTRLAIAVAGAAQDGFRDGMAWVDLALISESEGVAGMLMEALGVRTIQEKTTVAAIARAISDRQMLLIFDNAEHVIASVREITASLLRQCTQLSMLVTSREPVGTPGETQWQVPSLAVPEQGARLSGEELTKIPAISLFLERVRRFAPDFVPTETAAQQITHICRGLDGIPLAIEFAAARVRSLPLEAIVKRLDRVLGFLGDVDSSRPRHVTMRAALDWSYKLLEKSEQALLRRLAIFAGSFTLESAEVICSDQVLKRDLVARHLASLSERSLVVPPEPGAKEPRYRLLETVRQFAQEHLEEFGEDELFLQRHADHFVGIAEEATEHLRGHQQLVYHLRLGAEYSNLRAVLQRSRTDTGLSVRGLRMAAALGMWWWWFGRPLFDARTWLDIAAETPQPNDRTEARVWARATLQAGLLAWEAGELELARAWTEKALQVLEGQDPWHAALAQMVRGFVLGISGDAAGSSELLADARSRFEYIGDRWGPALLASIEATAARFFGDPRDMQQEFESAAEQLRAAGDEHLVWAPLHNLGQIAAEQGDALAAARFFADALNITLKFDDRLRACACIAGLGQAAAVGGEPLRAAELLASAESLLERMGSNHQPQNKLMYDRVAEDVLAATDDAAFKEAWQRGSRRTFESAVALSMRVDSQSDRQQILTSREQEVAKLVGDGLTNRQIAEKLSISRHTAERHVERILAKLRMSSRVEIATWMIRRES